MRQIAIAMLMSFTALAIACAGSTPVSSGAGDDPQETVSKVIQTEGGGACVCDMTNCEWKSCGCDDDCSSGDACVACCKEICDACGSCGREQ